MNVVESSCIKSHQAVTIHPTAIIADTVVLEPGVQIGAFVCIEGDVLIGQGTIIEPFARIQGPTIIGKYNKIRSYSSIGCDPQDKKFNGGDSRLVIGDYNDIREYTTLSRGTAEAGGLTEIGSHNLLMAYVHIAHDCRVGDHNTFANNSSIAGHVIVGDYVGMGGFSGVHQFCRIGSYAFCGGGSLITKDVPPFTLISGHPAQLYGLNLEGLKRRGFSQERVHRLKKIYRILFREAQPIYQTLEQITSDELHDDELLLIDFIKQSQRGLTR